MASWGQKCGKFPPGHHSERLSFFHLRKLACTLTSVILLHFVQMKIRINSTDVSALLYWKLIGDYCQALPRPFNLCAAFTEWQRSEGTTGEPLDQPACSKQAARDLVQSHPSISKDGDSTTSLDKLCQLITLIVKKSFSVGFNGIFCNSACVLSLSFHWAPQSAL